MLDAATEHKQAGPRGQGEYAVEFLRRQHPSHALPAAASVLYESCGILHEAVSFAEEVRLIKDVAGEIYRSGQQLPWGEHT